jgi:hypothetical protein
MRISKFKFTNVRNKKGQLLFCKAKEYSPLPGRESTEDRKTQRTEKRQLAIAAGTEQ